MVDRLSEVGYVYKREPGWLEPAEDKQYMTSYSKIQPEREQTVIQS